jgi:putative NADH-flavin reductase
MMWRESTKLIVFGATGRTGHLVVEQALAAGHEVTAVARGLSALTIQHPRLEVIRGDVLELSTFEQAITGKDAVISTLGGAMHAPTTLYSVGIANIVRAMQEACVRRLVSLSAGALDPGPFFQRVAARLILWPLFGNGYADMARMEAALSKSQLDWTVIRPPRLTNGPHTGRYHTAVKKHLSGGRAVSRANLADYIVTPLADPTTYRAWLEIANAS